MVQEKLYTSIWLGTFDLWVISSYIITFESRVVTDRQ